MRPGLTTLVAVATLSIISAQALSSPSIRCNTELFCFAANTPARAGEINGNFALVMDRVVPIGAIVMWNGATPPTGWALCDGQSYARSDGGGNITTPDLRSRFVVGAGTGTSLSTYAVGATGGAENVTLTQAQMPSHTHGVSDPGHRHNSIASVYAGQDLGDGSSRYSGGGGDPLGHGGNPYQTTTSTTGISLGSAGSGGSHENRPPYVALSYIMKY